MSSAFSGLPAIAIVLLNGDLTRHRRAMNRAVVAVNAGRGKGTTVRTLVLRRRRHTVVKGDAMTRAQCGAVRIVVARIP